MAAAWPEIVISTPSSASRISRAVRAGQLIRLSPGVYTPRVGEDLAALTRRSVWTIAAAVFPGAVITDRTAFELGPAEDGSVFLGTDRARDVVLPGLTLRARKAAGPLDGDTQFMGLHLASRARAYLENMRPSRARRTVARTLSRRELEERLDRDLRDRGERYLNDVRDQACTLAPQLGLPEELQQLDALIGSLLGTREGPLQSDVGRARAAGLPYDARRDDLFRALHAELLKLSPRPRPARESGPALAFFEAYFSNFIEGTEFEVDEAVAIVFEGQIPIARSSDAHDVLGTFRVVSDRREMQQVPRTAEQLMSLLRARHRTVMEARVDKMPGELKARQNRAGETVFVAPDLVAGTLARGLELRDSLSDPFARAVFMMFLVSEVHPFVDGNGRVARIMMNAELVAAGEERIIVPTIFRSNYLSGLKAMSHQGHATTLIRSLDFLQNYTSKLDSSSLEAARAQLTATNAFLDPVYADAEGIRLVLPY